MIAFALDDAANAVKAQADLQAIAGPWMPGDRVKRRIERAARAVGLGYSRASDIWYRKARQIRPSELARIAAAGRLNLTGAPERGAPRVPESDLDRLRSLESEVAELRTFLVETLQRLEGQTDG